MGSAYAQTPHWQEVLQQWMTTEEMEEELGTETMELLEERAENKINLNQTSREELEQLPFLSARQVEGIMEYLYRYGPMRSLSELQMITSLDYHTRRLLLYFVTAGEEKAKRVWPSLSDVAKYGKHSLTLTGKIPFYNRKGDRDDYLGYKYRHDLRYQFKMPESLSSPTATQRATTTTATTCNCATWAGYRR